ncbi:putative PIG3 family NAD(P)H quinone oxidoreductase [Paraburkholderia silvatlantica]|uniref:Putative PIG3 family NAD(P)H quinone oxidoreductase n=1 Tax=Paraburkholderia silvatlantica TaxID=321895 RepID=A0A2V4TG86_9BURK|nr:NAD(P)H-quinone oxidoreductase [Paraburkholderia silvatlantica]PYE18391.1 putative PIG3 family NAD(P)H quinone oxidoreductase [Paraburkholderia silvatlantica]
MQAILFDDFGEADVLHLGDAPDPDIRPCDLLVRVHAAGVNRADINQRRGAYGRPDFGDSTLMGLEIAGEVIGIGPEVEGYRVGDRVMGIVGGGAYATLARIDYRMAIPVPAGLDYVQAAAIPEVFVTAHEALIHLAGLQQGETALIHAAAGGVGTAAVQLAQSVGARVFGTARTDRHDALRALGVETCIDFDTEDFAEVVERTTAGKGVDVVVDFIGAPYLARNVRCLAEGGRLIQVGIMGGAADAALPLDRVLFRHLKIIGTVMKSRPQDVKQSMVSRFRDRWFDRFADGSVRPVVDCALPLARAADAHRRMESGGAFGKIVLVP